VPFDPLSFLSGGGIAGLPSFTGGAAGPAFSDADSGASSNSASVSGAFVIGGGNQLAGGGSPGGAGGSFGALTSSNLFWIVAIAGGAWLILQLRRR
jgi:hypothetical protein